MNTSFRGRTALLLGGSSAIGLTLARLLLAEGLRIVPTHASEAGREAIAAACPELAPMAVRLDLGDPSSRAALEPVMAWGIDYLVDLAQADHEGLLAAAAPAEAEGYFQAHVTGRLLLLKAVTRSMLARHFGRLVHVSSTAAALPAAGQGFYGAAKHAAESLYHSMGLELGDRGVTALNLRLGLVDAGRGARFLATGERRQRLARHVVPLDQAAATIAFALSDQALGLTCTTITMDAGLTARKYL